MQNAVRAEIKRLSARIFAREAAEASKEVQYRSQFEKRTGKVAGIPFSVPKTFQTRHFDPRYCKRNANFLAKTIWYKVLALQYEPHPAVNYQIPKPDGSKRSIMAFSIPDAALANVVLRRARDRNLKRLSPSSYAYHPDRNVFDAILYLKDFDYDGKLFAVQIDFEKYFDNIPSWYLEKKINERFGISLTPHERLIFQKFIHHRFANVVDYKYGKFQRRIHGTPQGSSVSLLLANLANHDLDTALSSASGRFVRFADDVLALCNDYVHAQEIERCFEEHCKISGLKTNQKKSPGIAVISTRSQEIRHYEYFDYLGYRFYEHSLTIPDKTVVRLKSKISRLINIYLIQYLEFGFNKNRSKNIEPVYDWDLLGLIYEIRRSLYGGLSEYELHSFLNDGKKLRAMKGLMGFYCLLDESTALKALDGWMVSMVRRAMVVRRSIIEAEYGGICPAPSNRELILGSWLDLNAWKGDEYPDPRMPSFVRGWRAARKYFVTFGLENVQAPRYSEYGDASILFEY